MVTNGGGESAVELLLQLLEQDIYIDVCFDETRDIPDWILKICRKTKVHVIKYKNIKHLEKLINQKQYDKVVFPVCASNYGKMQLNREIHVVSIIHDLSTIYADNSNNNERLIGLNILSKLKVILKSTLLKNYMQKRHFREHYNIFYMTDNQQIITVSNYSKYAICYYFGKELEKKITVCYSSNLNNELDCDRFRTFLIENKLISDKYFLLVSGSRWHKNNYFGIQTLDKMYSNDLLDRTFKVVITGLDLNHKKHYNNNINNKEQFVFLEYVEAEIMEGLYKNMFALIYPSLYEGFGFPAVYAMKYGKNILATSWTSLPEVCQNIAHYFDPTKQESLAVAVMEVISKPISSDMIMERYNEIKNIQNIDRNKIIEIILA